MAKTKKTAKSTIREFIESILFAIIAAYIIRIFVVEAYAIPTGSMKGTLLIGDQLIANKFIYGVRTPDRIPLTDIKIPHFRLPEIRQPERGDIVIFKYPKDMTLNYVKRCIALPGQTIEARNGDIFIDGKHEGKKEFIKREYDPLEGQYCLYYKILTDDGLKYTVRYYESNFKMLENWGPVKVPEGHYFMMGDNRDNSADSRSWGFVPADNVLGKPLIIYWSWDKNVPLYKVFNKIRWNRITKVIS